MADAEGTPPLLHTHSKTMGIQSKRRLSAVAKLKRRATTANSQGRVLPKYNLAKFLIRAENMSLNTNNPYSNPYSSEHSKDTSVTTARIKA